MRTMISIYRQLGQYIDTMDTEARARGEPEDTTIDAHFRSGVYLGVGMSNIILSLMPAKLQTIVELFGYKGDRQLGLQSLMKAGGWSTESNEPSVCASASFPLFKNIRSIPMLMCRQLFLCLVTTTPITRRFYHHGLNYLIARGGRRPTMHLRHGAPHLPPYPLQHHL